MQRVRRNAYFLSGLLFRRQGEGDTRSGGGHACGGGWSAVGASGGQIFQIASDAGQNVRREDMPRRPFGMFGTHAAGSLLERKAVVYVDGTDVDVFVNLRARVGIIAILPFGQALPRCEKRRQRRRFSAIRRALFLRCPFLSR